MLCCVMATARFEWMANDPEIVSDVLFAVANVLSIARTTYLMPAFEVLGTLQISLVRMIGDIARFIVLFTLVSTSIMTSSRLSTVIITASSLARCRPPTNPTIGVGATKLKGAQVEVYGGPWFGGVVVRVSDL